MSSVMNPNFQANEKENHKPRSENHTETLKKKRPKHNKAAKKVDGNCDCSTVSHYRSDHRFNQDKGRKVIRRGKVDRKCFKT